MDEVIFMFSKSAGLNVENLYDCSPRESAGGLLYHNKTHLSTLYLCIHALEKVLRVLV